MTTNAGIYGAKVQSWAKSNPRDILRKIITDNPGADKPALLALCREELMAPENVDHLLAVVEYWFANNYNSLIGGQPTEERNKKIAEASKKKKAKIDKIKKSVGDLIKREAEMILLDMVTPTGKRLRDCTGNDCLAAGGWFAKLARKLKPEQKVSKIFSEKDLRVMWRSEKECLEKAEAA